jgi:hypothetical protein
VCSPGLYYAVFWVFAESPFKPSGKGYLFNDSCEPHLDPYKELIYVNLVAHREDPVGRSERE